MQFLEDLFIEPARFLKAFLLGRGLLTAAVFATWGVASLLQVSALVPAGVAALGGIAFSGFMRITRQTIYEDQMVNMYRDGIAQQLGIDPQQVTRAHLKEAAKDNDVIDQALNRQRHMSWISFGTTALGAASTVALIAFGVPAMLTFGTGAAAATLGAIAFGAVSAITSAVVHYGAQSYISQKTGVAHAAAHDRIVEMERGLARGWGVSREQVYGTLVAGNPALQQTIIREFGKSYGSMRPVEQSSVLQQIGVAEEMWTIAQEINAGRMRPANLAFMLNEAMPRANHIIAEAAHTPQRSHVAALGRAPRDESIGHTARLDAERAMAALAEPAR